MASIINASAGLFDFSREVALLVGQNYFCELLRNRRTTLLHLPRLQINQKCAENSLR